MAGSFCFAITQAMQEKIHKNAITSGVFAYDCLTIRFSFVILNFTARSYFSRHEIYKTVFTRGANGEKNL